MSTRQIKNARDLKTNELIYFKSHAKATYLSDGSTVEDTINNIKEKDVDLSDYVTSSQLSTALSGKQDKIDDLVNIREGAALAENSVQYNDKDFGIASMEGISTSDGNIYVLPNTLAANEGLGDVLATLNDIPEPITINTVSDWGFIKDKGIYIIPDLTLEDIYNTWDNGETRTQYNTQALLTKSKESIICIRAFNTQNTWGIIPAISSVKEDMLYLLFYDEYINKVISLTVYEEDEVEFYVKNLSIYQVSDLLNEVYADDHGITIPSGIISDKKLIYALPSSANGVEDSILLSSTNVKTINGETILGNGNITIESGNSSIIDETCKIYYTGSINESLLPTEWGNAKLLEKRGMANVNSNGLTSLDFIQCLIFDSPLNYIPMNAFSGQTELRTIYLPANFKSCGSNVFKGCSKLVYIDARYYNNSSANLVSDINTSTVVISASPNINSEISNFKNAFYANNYAPEIHLGPVKVEHPIPYRNGLTTAYSTRAIENNDILISIPNYIMRYKVALPKSGAVTLSPSNNSGIVFTMGTTACQIALNGTWQWVNGEPPVFEAGNTYEINFYDGRAACVTYL